MKDERILVYAVYEFTTQAVTKRPSKKERAKKKKKKYRISPSFVYASWMSYQTAYLQGER